VRRAEKWLVLPNGLALVVEDRPARANPARQRIREDDRTPDEVYFHQPRSWRATPTTFFEGRLKWYRFGY
jgi:hypothetical protein